MKHIITLLVAVIICFAANAQNYSQKYNSLMDRTEFFDSYGNLQGWAKYNSLMKRMEYFDRYGNMTKYEQRNDLLDRNETKDT